MINLGRLSQGIQRFLAIKGGLTLPLGGEVSPTLQVANILDSPYARYGVPVSGERTATAVAGARGYVVFRPGANVVLQVKQLWLVNRTAAAVIGRINLMRAADIAGLDTPQTSAQMFELSANDGSSFAELASSTAERYTDAVDTLGQGALAQFTIPANQQIIVDLPSPGIMLFGNDPAGRPGLAVVNSTANENITAVCFGTEWPLPA